MLTLGVDTGSRNIGFAIYDAKLQEIIYTKEYNPKLYKHSKEVDLSDFYEFLYYELFEHYNIEQIIIEKVFATPKTIGNLFRVIECIGILRYAAQLEDITLVTKSPKTIKKDFAGNGNATKEDIAAEVVNRFSIYESSTHVNDAIAISTCFDVE